MSNLQIHRGDDETLEVVVTDPDTGDPINLTGATLAFMVKAAPDDADDDALVDLDTVAGITVTSAVDGEATIAIADTDTDDIAPGVYFWELQSVDATSKVHTLAGGRIFILRGVVGA